VTPSPFLDPIAMRLGLSLRASVILGPLLAAALPMPAALAQTPVERAARLLEEGERRDRAAEAAAAARGESTVVPPAQVLPMESDRRSLQPDVGRPEEAGVATTGGPRSPSSSQNPQR
jgi:hypothetical protein